MGIVVCKGSWTEHDVRNDVKLLYHLLHIYTCNGTAIADSREITRVILCSLCRWQSGLSVYPAALMVTTGDS
jgi:hypothetical protein